MVVCLIDLIIGDLVEFESQIDLLNDFLNIDILMEYTYSIIDFYFY